MLQISTPAKRLCAAARDGAVLMEVSHRGLTPETRLVISLELDPEAASQLGFALLKMAGEARDVQDGEVQP